MPHYKFPLDKIKKIQMPPRLFYITYRRLLKEANRMKQPFLRRLYFFTKQQLILWCYAIAGIYIGFDAQHFHSTFRFIAYLGFIFLGSFFSVSFFTDSQIYRNFEEYMKELCKHD